MNRVDRLLLCPPANEVLTCSHKCLSIEHCQLMTGGISECRWISFQTAANSNMKPHARRFSFVLSILFVFLVRTNYAKHIHNSVKLPEKVTAMPESRRPSTEPIQSTIPPDELEDLFNWFEVPEQTSKKPSTDEEHQQQGVSGMRNSSIIYPLTNSESDIDKWTTQGSSRPVSSSKEPATLTADKQPIISELLDVLQNLTTPSKKPESNNESVPLKNITSISELFNTLEDLHIEDIKDLENITYLSNDSLIENLLNATEQANVTSLNQLRNLTNVLSTDDIDELTAALRNISSMSEIMGVNRTENIQNSESPLMNVTSLDALATSTSGLLGTGNFTGNSAEGQSMNPIFGENVTEGVMEYNESSNMIGDITHEQQTFIIPNTTTEISRLETATNDEFWPPNGTATTGAGSSEPLTTEEPITNKPVTNEETTTSLTSNQSSSTERKPEASSFNATQSESADKVNKWNNPYFGGLVTALVFGCLFVVILVVFVSKRFYDGYQRRHYTKMDYLVNGMYN